MFTYRIWICWDLARISLASSRKLGLKVANRFNIWKNLLNDESLERNVAILRKNCWSSPNTIQLCIGNEMNKNPENLQCALCDAEFGLPILQSSACSSQKIFWESWSNLTFWPISRFLEQVKQDMHWTWMNFPLKFIAKSVSLIISLQMLQFS